MPESRPSFFKRHSRWFTFIGALIVFVTFVFKDNLREDWRSTADQIDMARNFYAVRSETRGIYSHLNRVEYMQDDAANSSDPLWREARAHDTSADSRLRRFQMSVETDMRVDDYVKVDNDVLRPLIEHLPNPTGQMAKLKAMDHLADKAHDRSFAVEQEIENARTGGLGNDDLRRFKMLTEQSSQATQNVTRLNDDLRYSILKQADDLERTNACRAAFANWISICAYVLGWGLGLIGKLVGGADFVAI